MCFYIFRQLLFVYLYFRSHIEQLCRDVELAFINTSEPAINKSYDAEELFVRSDAVAFFFFWMMNKAKLIRKLDETYGVTISKSGRKVFTFHWCIKAFHDNLKEFPISKWLQDIFESLPEGESEIKIDALASK